MPKLLGKLRKLTGVLRCNQMWKIQSITTDMTGVVIITSLIILGLFILSDSTWFVELNSRIFEITQARPISKFYFPMYAIIGLLIPLILRLKYSNKDEYKKVLNPYLLFLLGQIICEAIFVIRIGKGIGVIIGIVFSLIRISQ